MSRNKSIVTIVCLIAIVYFLPMTGTAGMVRRNLIALAPYLFLGVILYLFVTINLLRKAIYRLHDHLSTEHALDVVKKMNLTFDVKRMLGTENLTNLYREANFSKHISSEAKTALYQAMKRKRLDVPPPASSK